MNKTFIEQLKTLVEWAEKVNCGNISHNDFISFQREEPQRIKAYQGGELTQRQYDALSLIYFEVKQDFRKVLKLD